MDFTWVCYHLGNKQNWLNLKQVSIAPSSGLIFLSYCSFEREVAPNMHLFINVFNKL